MFYKYILLLSFFVPSFVFSANIQPNWTIHLPSLQQDSFGKDDSISANIFYGGIPSGFEGNFGCSADNHSQFPFSLILRQSKKYFSYFENTESKNNTAFFLRKEIFHHFPLNERIQSRRNDCLRFSHKTVQGLQFTISKRTLSGKSQSINFFTSYDTFEAPIFTAPLISYLNSKHAIASELTSIRGNTGFTSQTNFLAKEEHVWLSQYWNDARVVKNNLNKDIHIVFPKKPLNSLEKSTTSNFFFQLSFPVGSSIEKIGILGENGRTYKKILKTEATSLEKLYDGSFDAKNTGNIFCAYLDVKGEKVHTSCSLSLRNFEYDDGDTLQIQVRK